jgi:hypothetical protein
MTFTSKKKQLNVTYPHIIRMTQIWKMAVGKLNYGEHQDGCERFIKMWKEGFVA